MIMASLTIFFATLRVSITAMTSRAMFNIASSPPCFACLKTNRVQSLRRNSRPYCMKELVLLLQISLCSYWKWHMEHCINGKKIKILKNCECCGKAWFAFAMGVAVVTLTTCSLPYLINKLSIYRKMGWGWAPGAYPLYILEREGAGGCCFWIFWGGP